jgi:hypothetical protein
MLRIKNLRPKYEAQEIFNTFLPPYPDTALFGVQQGGSFFT